MRTRRLFPVRFGLMCLIALTGFGAGPAAAIIPVTDVAALAQLVSQLQTMQEQLTEAQNAVQSMSGSRGMGNLLGQLNRNYLPADWSQLAAALNGTATAYGSLGREVQGILRQNAVLTDAQISALTPLQRELLEAARTNAAALQGLSRQALSTTSQRFAAIEQLIQAIGTTTDQKGILELQARIGAETGMLQNEASKLQSIYRVTDAEERARAQRAREAALADVGSLRALPAMGL